MPAAIAANQQLSELSEYAYRLGVAFGEQAERATTTERKLEYFQLFDRCFFSVRVAIALELRLARAPAGRAMTDGASAQEDPERQEADRADSERESPERDSPDRDSAERDSRERDRERDREVEPVSLPILLRTLGGIAADASALPGPAPAALPALRELLAQMTSVPGPAHRPRGAGVALRTRLAGSATAMAIALPSPGGPGPALRADLPIRRATGPPRR